MSKPILCLDFDGVLHSYSSGWRGAANIPDPPVEGAIDFLVQAVERFEVAILSSRSHQWGGRHAMKAWLLRHLVDWCWRHPSPMNQDPQLYGLGYTAVDMDDDYTRWARDILRKVSFPLFKPAAMVTIDDRALTFTGIWPDLVTLREFKPWNKS